jgi:hypothetical protein
VFLVFASATPAWLAANRSWSSSASGYLARTPRSGRPIACAGLVQPVGMDAPGAHSQHRYGMGSTSNNRAEHTRLPPVDVSRVGQKQRHSQAGAKHGAQDSPKAHYLPSAHALPKASAQLRGSLWVLEYPRAWKVRSDGVCRASSCSSVMRTSSRCQDTPRPVAHERTEGLRVHAPRSPAGLPKYTVRAWRGRDLRSRAYALGRVAES